MTNSRDENDCAGHWKRPAQRLIGGSEVSFMGEIRKRHPT